jgi:hypothetical protein
MAQRCRFCLGKLEKPHCEYCRENAQKVAGVMQTANTLFRLRGEIFDPILKAKLLAADEAKERGETAKV